MSAFVVRFPDGSREFLYPERPLEVGDAVWHDGTRYHVIHVTEDAGRDVLTVTVEPEADSLGHMLGSEEGALVLSPVVD